MLRFVVKLLVVVFYLTYTFFCVGFFFRRSHRPMFLDYSLGQWAFCFLLLPPYALPWAFRTWIARSGGRQVAFALVPCLALFLCVYSSVALVYYNNQCRRFDPYLQKTSPPLPNCPTSQPGHDEVRILVLGGSTSQHYPDHLLPRLRRAYPQVAFDLLNEAMGFYTVKHSLLNFASYYDDFKPDLVLCLHGINDLTRSFNPPEYALGPYDDRWTHFYGAAARAASPPSLEHLAFRRLASVWYRDLRVREVEMPLERFPSLAPYLRHTERLLALLQAQGAVTVVLSQPTLWRSGPMTPDEEQHLGFQHKVCVHYSDYFHQEYPTTASLERAMAVFNRTTAATADRYGAHWVDAASAVPRDLEHFTDDCHFTPRGLEAVADAVMQALVSRRVIDQILEGRAKSPGEPGRVMATP